MNPSTTAATTTAASETLEEWTQIFTHINETSSTVVFWLIFVVSFILLLLKLVKCVLKWRKKKLSTADTIDQLNSVLTGLVAHLTQQQ